ADSNPSWGVTGDKVNLAADQGRQVAAEVDRLLHNYLAPLAGPIIARHKAFELPLADLPTRAEWQARSKRGGAVGYHARVQLARLDHGEKLMTEVPYSVTTWTFGNGLAMVFLPGEVVVDYALRLKRELDPGRLWINAYADDAPCYIPSERVLREGGYEGGDAMIYYDKPTRFRAGLENKIIGAVHALLPRSFDPPFDPHRLQGTKPLSPQQALTTFHTRSGFTVELMAAEPLVVDPVAIDFGPDGRLWVVEMRDYPSGMDGHLKPGGRVVVLEDTTGSGHYDKSTVFLDNLPFPTGIKVWRKGVLICAAPDILYAEDSDGDGKADVVRKLYSGWATHNYQARVNGLEYGLDNWLYGSGGLFGGNISSFKGGPPVPLANRDFRLKPDSGVIEAAAGRAQQGRVRNDWGDWFGCDNSALVRHYPLADHYLRRNPHFAPSANDVYVPGYPDSSLLYPVRQNVQMFKLSGPPRRVTSACGIGIYRDNLLGKQYTGNTFTCEPVNLLVHREVLQPKGETFVGRRAAEEAQAEFLAGTDGWSRLVQARTGPDGALWVVDMYRLVIEHPQWIPPEDLARLDVRAGQANGRIYRVYPSNHPPRPIKRLDKLDMPELVAALDSPNGPQRDLVQQMLVWKHDKTAVPPLERLTQTARPEGRLQALCTLDGLDALRPEILVHALADSHPGVRRHAARLAAQWVNRSPAVATALTRLADDADPQVQLQLACTLGAWQDSRAADLLASLAWKYQHDAYLLAGVFSSLDASNVGRVVAGVLARRGTEAADAQLVTDLIGQAAAFGNQQGLHAILTAVLRPSHGRFQAWQFAALGSLLEQSERQRRGLAAHMDAKQHPQLVLALDQARKVLAEDSTPAAERLAAISLLGRQPEHRAADIATLGEQLVPQNSVALQQAAVAALGRIRDDHVPGTLLEHWSSLSPGLRSGILDVLLSRPTWLQQLLAALEKGQPPPASIDAARRQLLLQHKDPAVRRLAAKVFTGSTNPDRQKVVDAYRDVLKLPADRARGKAVFARRCATCHLLEGVGHAVGADLGSMANKAPEALLIAILDPNQAVDNRFLAYLAVTKDGRMHNGVLAAETGNSITMREQDGKEEVILRTDLDEFQGTGKSLMPEGLEKDLSRQDLADVIAYVRGLEPPPKQVAGNEPDIVSTGKDGLIWLSAERAAIHGGDITFESNFRNIGCWHSPDDSVSWTVAVGRAGRYDVVLDYACHPATAGGRFVLAGAEPELRGQVASTGGWDKYRQTKIGTVHLSPGLHTLTLRAGSKFHEALMDLRGIRLTPR
ncbi:MAG TPA: PVC-type heme-binding CxxCH protein, partial [Gemmataceae bacterium]|nr:PVC-type heme-binding CxxCH protein [Gemmataceae bacterium]